MLPVFLLLVQKVKYLYITGISKLNYSVIFNKKYLIIVTVRSANFGEKFDKSAIILYLRIRMLVISTRISQ